MPERVPVYFSKYRASSRSGASAQSVGSQRLLDRFEAGFVERRHRNPGLDVVTQAGQCGFGLDADGVYFAQLRGQLSGRLERGIKAFDLCLET